MEESFGNVKQNKISVVHWITVFFMMFGGLGPVVYQLLLQPISNLTNPIVLLIAVMNILLFVAGLGVWNFKKWGLLLGLGVCIISILVGIINFGSVLKALGGAPFTFKTLISGGYFSTNFMIFLNEIGPFVSFMIVVFIFLYLLIKRNSFSKQ